MGQFSVEKPVLPGQFSVEINTPCAGIFLAPFALTLALATARHRRKLSRLQPHELVGGPRRDMGNPVVVACSLASLVALYAIRGRLGSRIGAVHLNPRTLRLLLFFL
jgi:hypothetical protein